MAMQQKAMNLGILKIAAGCLTEYLFKTAIFISWCGFETIVTNISKNLIYLKAT
jgi:hypothetical protein